MTTLQTQRSRLATELQEAESKLLELRQQPNPDERLVGFYSDLITRNRGLIQMIDTHLRLMPPLQDMGGDSASA